MRFDGFVLSRSYVQNWRSMVAYTIGVLLMCGMYAAGDGCPRITNLGASRTDLFYERRGLGTPTRLESTERHERSCLTVAYLTHFCQRRRATRSCFVMNDDTMIYTVCATNILRVIHCILHNRKPTIVLRRHPHKVVERVHVHL